MADEKKPWREFLQNETEKMKKGINFNSEKRTIKENIINGYISDSKKCLDSIVKNDIDKIIKISDILIDTYEKGNKIITMGNGGSAAISSHFVNDFSKAWLGDRLMRFKAICLTDNVSLLTAWMNDAGCDKMFVGPLETILEKGDVVIGISGSGNSQNVLDAIEYANAKGATTIGFAGFDGGKLKEKAHICFIVPSNSFKRIEDVHTLLGHLIKTLLVKEIEERNKKN